MPCVYILTNKAMPGLIKIGHTGGSANARAMSLSSTTGVPLPFDVAWTAEVVSSDAAYRLERAAHKTLFEFRINGAREFFELPVALASQEILKLGERFDLLVDTGLAINVRLNSALETLLLFSEIIPTPGYDTNEAIALITGKRRCGERLSSIGKCIKVLTAVQPHTNHPEFVKLFHEKVRDDLGTFFVGTSSRAKCEITGVLGECSEILYISKSKQVRLIDLMLATKAQERMDKEKAEIEAKRNRKNQLELTWVIGGVVATLGGVYFGTVGFLCCLVFVYFWVKAI